MSDDAIGSRPVQEKSPGSRQPFARRFSPQDQDGGWAQRRVPSEPPRGFRIVVALTSACGPSNPRFAIQSSTLHKADASSTYYLHHTGSRPVPKLGPAGIDERTAPLEIRLKL